MTVQCHDTTFSEHVKCSFCGEALVTYGGAIWTSYEPVHLCLDCACSATQQSGLRAIGVLISDALASQHHDSRGAYISCIEKALGIIRAEAYRAAALQATAEKEESQ